MPLDQLLRQYAALLVNTGCALKKGQELFLSAPVEAAPFARLVAQAAWEAGAGDVTVEWADQAVSRLRYLNAPAAAFDTVPTWKREQLNGAAQRGAALLFLEGEDPDGMAGIDPARFTAWARASHRDCKAFYDGMDLGRNVWCIAGVATAAWAQKVFPGVSEEEAVEKLWRAILSTARSDGPDPAKAWADHSAAFQRRVELLNKRQFSALHYTASNGTDFTVGMLPHHVWGGGGAQTVDGTWFHPNMPTEEIFTSPDREKADGIVYSALPLNYRGGLIEDFWVKFEQGVAVDCGAKTGADRLRSILDTDEGAKHLGEVALVPHDSPIAQSGILFYSTLYDENAACHLALGKGFPECLQGGLDMDEQALKDHHLNLSATHVDFMIGTADLSVTGLLSDGTQVPIFEKGTWAGEFV
jgi:aminopeptidase